MRKILLATSCLVVLSVNAQTTKSFGINKYNVPAVEPVKRYDGMFTTEGDYSLYYSEIVGDSVFRVREKFIIKNGVDVLDVVWVEHCGLKNKDFVFTINPATADAGHPETAYTSITVKDKEGKYTFKNGVKWMLTTLLTLKNVARKWEALQLRLN
jgi:hypothetical protein